MPLFYCLLLWNWCFWKKKQKINSSFKNEQKLIFIILFTKTQKFLTKSVFWRFPFLVISISFCNFIFYSWFMTFFLFLITFFQLFGFLWKKFEKLVFAHLWTTNLFSDFFVKKINFIIINSNKSGKNYSI